MEKAVSMDPKHFRRSFRVNATLEAVADFHNDSRTIKKLTPPPVWVQLHRVDPIKNNSIVDFTMWLGPIPVHWVAKHLEVNPKTGFIDCQMEGPFTKWNHRHSFQKVDEKTTEVVDEIEGILGTHPFWGLISRFMWLNLPILFAYRAWATKRALERV